MTQLPFVLALLLAAGVVVAAVYDIRYRRIPNWLSLTLVVLGLVLNLAVPGTPGIAASLIGVGVAALIYFPLYLLRAMGAGDVKLMAAVGAVVGFRNWFFVFFFSVVIGAMLGLLALLARGRLRRAFGNIAQIVRELAHFRAPYAKDEYLDVSSSAAVTMPHGAAIALGSLLYLVLSGPLFAP